MRSARICRTRRRHRAAAAGLALRRRVERHLGGRHPRGPGRGRGSRPRHRGAPRQHRALVAGLRAVYRPRHRGDARRPGSPATPTSPWSRRSHGLRITAVLGGERRALQVGPADPPAAEGTGGLPGGADADARLGRQRRGLEGRPRRDRADEPGSRRTRSASGCSTTAAWPLSTGPHTDRPARARCACPSAAEARRWPAASRTCATASAHYDHTAGHIGTHTDRRRCPQPESRRAPPGAGH